MNVQQIRAALERHWTASAAGNQDVEHKIYSEYGLDLTGDQLYFLNDPAYQARVVSAKRVGIDYAREWKDAPLRFLDAEHSVSDCLAEERHDTET